MSWIIVYSNDPDLAWSNTFGWCDTTYDTFDDEERDTLDLPMGGEWQQVPWRIGD